MPESEVKRDSTGGRGSLRVAASALVALVVAIAPSLLLFFGIHLFIRLDVEVVFLCLSLIFGGFVFTALERTQPEWRRGVAFGLGAAVGVTVLSLVRMSSYAGVNAGDMAAWGLVIVFFGTLLGMVGSGVASAASRLLVTGRGKRRWPKPWHLGAAVAVLVLVFVGVASAHALGPGLGSQSRVIPSALDAKAIDVKAAGSPAQLPALSTGVPGDSILEMTQWIAQADGRELHSRRWIDFQEHRARSDIYGDVASTYGGSTTTAIDPSIATILYADVTDATQSVSFNAADVEVRSDPATEASAFGGFEESGMGGDVVRLGQQLLDGVKVDVYRVDLNIPFGQERTADFGLIYFETASSLRVREEWLLGSPGHASVSQLLQYRLLPRTPELQARMRPEALIAEASRAVAERMAAVAKLDFPIWGLPSSNDGLVLCRASIMTSDRGTRVELAYRDQASLGGPAVSIATTDLRGRSDYPENLLGSRQDAIANSGDTDRLNFRMGTDDGGEDGTAVEILLWTDASGAARPAGVPSLATLAEELVDVRAQAVQ